MGISGFLALNPEGLTDRDATWQDHRADQRGCKRCFSDVQNSRNSIGSRKPAKFQKFIAANWAKVQLPNFQLW